MVSSANHRSTRLIRLLEVGVRCSLKRGCACSQRLICGGLVRGGVIEDEVHVEVLGDLLVDGSQELLEHDRAMAGVQLADHLPGRQVQCGVGWRFPGACSRGWRARVRRGAAAGSAGCGPRVESPGGVSPPGAHRSRREPLDSPGSCHPARAADAFGVLLLVLTLADQRDISQIG